jgi:SAM-dependent methyltransferase
MGGLYDDPALYDRLYASDRSRAFYAAIAARGASVLELACGTGRLALPLAEGGVDVTGLDRSPAMLAAARGKPGAERVTWIEADMTRFATGRTYDAIVLAHNSLLHLHDSAAIVACFERVRDHLAADGRFAFDVFNPSLRLLAQPAGTRTALDGTDGVAVHYDAATQVNRATIFVGERALPLHLRCIFPQELSLLLERGGLALESRAGDFDGGAFASASRHQVCVCRRA